MRRAKDTYPAIACIALMLTSSPARSVELEPATAEAFRRYVEKTEERIRGEVADPQRFLHLDGLAQKQRSALMTHVHNGHVFIQAMRTTSSGKEIEVPDGLVHHWLAVGFIPGVSLEQAVALAQDYPRQPQLYAPDVQRTRVLAHNGGHYAVEFRFYRKAIVTAVYNAEFTTDYYLPDAAHGYCFARAVRIAEVQNPGKRDEKEYPVGNDHGYLWRLNLYTRYLERDNGVYIQIEFLALSRTVPSIFAWLVNPYVRSIPREYLAQYLMKTRKALAQTNKPS